MMTERTITLHLEPGVIAEIEDRDDCTAGVEVWIRRIISRELGLLEEPWERLAGILPPMDGKVDPQTFALGSAMKLVDHAQEMASAAGLELQARIVPPGTPLPWVVPEEA